MTLISLIIKSYMTTLIVVGSVAALAFVLGLYFIVRTMRAAKRESMMDLIQAKQTSRRSQKVDLPDTASDVSTISGEDPMATQLDLARAYIETGKNPFAKIILATVIKEGNSLYQEEAKRLLSNI